MPYVDLNSIKLDDKPDYNNPAVRDAALIDVFNPPPEQPQSGQFIDLSTIQLDPVAPTQQPPAPQKDYATRLTGDLQDAGNEVANIVKNIGNQNPASSALQILGQGAKVASAPVAQGLASLASFIPQGVKDYVSDSAVGDVARQYAGAAGENIGKIQQAYPELSKDAGAALNLFGTLAGGKVATAASAPVTKRITPLIDDISSKGEPVAAMAKSASEAVVPTIDKATAKLAKRATEDFGIDLRLDQISPTRARKTIQKVSQEVPFSGVDAAETIQRAQWNKALAKTIGQEAEDLSPATITKFLDDAKVKFETAIGDNPIKFSANDINNFKKVAKSAQGNITKDYSDIVSGKAKNIIDQLFDTSDKVTRKLEIGDDLMIKPKVTTSKTVIPKEITGKKLASIRSQLINELPNIEGAARGYVANLVDAIDDIAAKNMTKESASILKQARREWRNFKTIEPLLEKATDGQVNPTDLLNKVSSSKYIKASRTGTGTDDLVDLARIGKQFLPKAGGSDTAQKAALMMGIKGAVGGGLAGLSTVSVAPAAAAVVGTGANRGLQALNQSQKLVAKSIKKSLKP